MSKYRTKWFIGTLFIVLSLLSTASSAMEWQWLDAMRVAVQEQNYRGEFIHRRGDKTSAYSVAHRFDGKQSTELLRELDGDMIEVLRQGQKSVCYYPEGSEAALTSAVPAAPFTQVTALNLERISQNYKAMSTGEERVVGYKAHVVTLHGDEWRYSQKLWLELNTNLLLQSELLDADGKVLEQFRFTRLELGVNIADNELLPAQMKAGMRQQTVYRSMTEKLSTDGFQSELAWLPTGFVLTNSELTRSADGWSEQRTFSDGLSSFSVFVEQDSGIQGQAPMMAKMGATNAYMAMNEAYGITVVGEVPLPTAKKVAQNVSLLSPSL